MFKLLIAATLMFVCSDIYAGSSVRVDEIKVRLFYQHSGTLSEPLTGKEALWNTIIGEGDAKEDSNSTFVDVTVTGEPGAYSDSIVQLLVTDKSTGKIISTQTQDVGVLSAAGRYHLGFWIAPTGCEPLLIKASIKGSKSTKQTEVPFHCGE